MFGSRSSKKTGLKIIIVGCGKVGVAILKQLANEGHDITIIDKDPQKVATYANQYDVMGIVETEQITVCSLKREYRTQI